MAKRKVPLGSIRRGGVALPFLDRDIKMTIPDPDLVRLVVEALRRLPNCDPPVVPAVYQLGRLQVGWLEGIDYVALAREMTRSIQAGLLMEQVPEFKRLTDKQKLTQLDALDATIAQLDESLGELRRETWAEVVAVKPDLPPTPTIVREGLYNLWRGLHEAVRESRRRLQDTAQNRGSRPNGPAARAAEQAGKVYQWITGKDAKIRWNDAAGEYRAEFLPFLTEIFEIFNLDGKPATYARKD